MQGLSRTCAAALVVTCWSRPALALTVNVPVGEPSQVDGAHTFRAVVQDAVGAVQLEWDFGEGPVVGTPEMTHTFRTAGHVPVDVRVQDAAGNAASASFQHLVHHPLKATSPTSSSSIVFDRSRDRIYNVNQDNDTVTSIDATKLSKVAEVAVYRKPESLAVAPNGKLWVVHQDDYAVAIIDPESFVIERGFRLPYASQPVGIAMSPTRNAAYISLMALGKLLKLDSQSGELLGEVAVGPWARGVSVSHDGKDVFVTRFISPDTGGEVVQVDGATMRVVKTILLAPDRASMDSDQAARGVPSYLFSIGLSPDGRQGWVAAKKDNIFRGRMRDGLDLTHETTVRPLVCLVDLATGLEAEGMRIDLDDRSLPAHVTFSPFGDFGIITLAGSNRIEIRDAYAPTRVFSAIADVGKAPRSTALGPNGRLFVQGALSRNVLVYDLSNLIREFDSSTPRMLADIPTVSSETLPPAVLRGKILFHSSADVRMTKNNYLSCAACHFEGLDDGRVYDFTGRGEGLRNTPSLLGRRGTGQGRLNWGATFDEVQDFEEQIRDLLGGRGFIANDLLEVGTRKQPLGDSKAGLSGDLDDLATYVTSLDHVNPSPFRAAGGVLTEEGQAGKLLFSKLGCNFCHGGPDVTDSERGRLHDVGTVTVQSGKRAGGPLLGLDSPTLLGIWETAPYLHDGSAATLRDVLTTKNPQDQHGYVSSLTTRQIDQLVAYMLQIDDERPPHPLPFEPSPSPMPPAPDAGARDAGYDGSDGADVGVAGGDARGGDADTPNSVRGGLSCSSTKQEGDDDNGSPGLVVLLIGWAAFRRPDRQRRYLA